MGAVLILVGLVATVQGVAWIGRGNPGRRVQVAGAVLAPAGLATLTWGIAMTVGW